MNVVRKLPVGVVGEIADSSLQRTLTETVGTGDVEIGKVITKANGVVAQGGTGNYAGIVTGPKQMSKDGLGETLKVKANGFVQSTTFGRIWVRVKSAVTVGAQAAYDASGNIGATGASMTAIPNSKFLTAATGATGDTMAMIELS